MAVIGIDLGTTYSAAAVFVDGEARIVHLEGHTTQPSVMSLAKGGRILIGERAKRNQAASPENTIVESKRLMGMTDAQGRPRTLRLGEKDYLPQEVAAQILTQIRTWAEAELNEPVAGAVISCPAYFKNPQRAAIEEAAMMAGLKLLRIVNEPTAAAYAYGVRENRQGEPVASDKTRLFVVYDLGGGTFDVTVMRMSGTLEVIGTGGDPNLGGGNFDDCIVDWMVEKLKVSDPAFMASLDTTARDVLRLKLKYFAEECKKKLCDEYNAKLDEGVPHDQIDVVYTFQISSVANWEGKPVVFRHRLTISEFDEMILPLLDPGSLRWVDEALKVPREKHSFEENDITAILLVGGSTRVPLVRRVLQRRFPGIALWGMERGINPDEIVALGAALIAAEADPDNDDPLEIPPPPDVTGHTLSIEVRNSELNRDELLPIVVKDTPIPCVGKHRVVGAGKFTTSSRIRVYQGEGIELNPEHVMMIGEFVISYAPIEEPTPLEITLSLDRNGLLIATAQNLLTGEAEKCEVNYQGSAQLSPDQIAARQAQLAQDREVGVKTAQGMLGLDGATPAGTAATRPAPSPAKAAPASGTAGASHMTGASGVSGASGMSGSSPPAGHASPVPPAQSAAATDLKMNPFVAQVYQSAMLAAPKLSPEKQSQLFPLLAELAQTATTGDMVAQMQLCAQISVMIQES